MGIKQQKALSVEEQGALGPRLLYSTYCRAVGGPETPVEGQQQQPAIKAGLSKALRLEMGFKKVIRENRRDSTELGPLPCMHKDGHPIGSPPHLEPARSSDFRA